jgi:microsomal dipeptidase-like Zn-dependent dipeptidase
MRLPHQLRLRTIGAFALLVPLLLASTRAASVPAAASDPLKADMTQEAKAAADLGPQVLGRKRTEIPADRYAMAGGCYAMRASDGSYIKRNADPAPVPTAGRAKAAEPFYFRATDLGSYLLFGKGKDFLAASEGEVGKAAEQVTDSSVGGAVGGVTMENTDKVAHELATGPAGSASGRGETVVLAAKPSELADWKVTRAEGRTYRFTLPSEGLGLVAKDGKLDLVPTADLAPTDWFHLERVGGCAHFPESKVNVSGPVTGGPTPYGEVKGYYDGHLHAMAFEFLGGRARCGQPWHPWGVEFALKGCKEHEIAGGRAAVLENFLSGRDSTQGHDTNAGWPTFTDWPKHSSLTYEQVYYKWLERAWRGGVRMFTNLLVDNNKLCQIYPYKSHGCNEMDTVRLEAKRIHQLERYIDAQYGGPGRGWFRIVDDPFEARRIMNDGKLAVVLGIEVSVLFDCGTIRGVAQCTEEQIDQRLDEVYKMGVRQMELVNKFDNALSGVTGDGGVIGPLVNGANFLQTGSFWQMRTCPEDAGHSHDKEQPNFSQYGGGAPPPIGGRDSLVGVILNEVGGRGVAPTYGPGPHCNQLGLTSLGEHLIKGMIAKGMVFDPDHMSATARSQAMDILEEAGYSGVISSHSWADETIYPRVWALGGVVTPHAGSSEGFVQDWRENRPWRDKRFYYGLGFGSDMNGFSTQGGPPSADSPKVTYPFTGLGGVTIDKLHSGRRVFDYNNDGVAHYGMYPDFVEHVRLAGGDKGEVIARDMRRASEAFLQMWERAVGIPPSSCRPDVADLDGRDFNRVRYGMTPEQVLIRLGQPSHRRGDTFTYCFGSTIVSIIFGADGRVENFDKKVRSDAATPGTQTSGDQQADPTSTEATAAGVGSGVAAPHTHPANAAPHTDLASAPGPQGTTVVGIAVLALLAAGLMLALRRRASR